MEQKINEDLIVASGKNIDINEIWANALRILQTSKKISQVAYEVWIENLEPVDVKGNCFVLSAQSVSHKNRISSGEIKKEIISALNQTHSAITTVDFCCKDDLKEIEPQKIQPKTREKTKSAKDTEQESSAETISSAFDPKYTFDNFVIGSSNQFVTAAAKAVAENPAGKYNPLFIYGGVGLGKTHLLHAIGNYITETKPDLKVVYVTCDKFVNELINSIYDSKRNASTTFTGSFRDKYRKADVLIVDDIQCIIGKSAVQTEFFHTFNDLNAEGKQIVISSDRPPKELNPLEERLRSRFEWGLMADIGVPDIETKIAILIKKAQLEHYNVSRDVIEFIAEVPCSNVREIEGMLNRAVFYSGLLSENIVTLDNAREALKSIVIEGESKLDAGRIIDSVCKYYNIQKEALLARKRTKEIAMARQIAMYLISDMLEMPLQAVGDIFGKDHATVIYAKAKVSEDMAKDKKFATEINDIRQMAKGK